MDARRFLTAIVLGAVSLFVVGKVLDREALLR